LVAIFVGAASGRESVAKGVCGNGLKVSTKYFYMKAVRLASENACHVRRRVSATRMLSMLFVLVSLIVFYVVSNSE
jgi:hypothetical protein